MSNPICEGKTSEFSMLYNCRLNLTCEMNLQPLDLLTLLWLNNHQKPDRDCFSVLNAVSYVNARMWKLPRDHKYSVMPDITTVNLFTCPLT